MSNENTERSDRAGWYEFIMPGGSTTHIAYAHENGTVYLPEGEDVVSVQDFHLASASDRFWRLVREPQQVTTVAELDALPAGTIILDGDPDALLKAHMGNWRSLVDPEEPFKSNRLTLPATVLHSPVVDDA